MSKRTNGSKWLWIVFFALIFLLTQSQVLWTYDASPSLFGLPHWLWYFMAFHLLLVMGLVVFSKQDQSFEEDSQ